MNARHALIASGLLAGAAFGAAAPLLGGERVPEPIPIPDLVSFRPNSPARAEEVNTNFQSLRSCVSSLRDSVVAARGMLNDFTGELIEDGTVTAADLATDALTADQLGPDSVTADEIASGAVGQSELADGSVGSEKIADGSVTLADLAEDAVDSSKIADEPGLMSFKRATVEGPAEVSLGLHDHVSKEITIPRTGFVLAMGSLTVEGALEYVDDGVDEDILCQFGFRVDSDPTFDAAASLRLDDYIVMPAGDLDPQDTLKYEIPVSFHDVFPVSSGLHNLRLTTKIAQDGRPDSDDPFRLHNVRMTLLYIPSQYGDVGESLGLFAGDHVGPSLEGTFGARGAPADGSAGFGMSSSSGDSWELLQNELARLTRALDEVRSRIEVLGLER
jgi:hypothetical protein